MHLFVYSYVDLSGVTKQAFWESETEAVNVSRIGEKLSPSHKLLRVYRLSDGHCVWEEKTEPAPTKNPPVVSDVATELANMVQAVFMHRYAGMDLSEALDAACARHPNMRWVVRSLVSCHFAAVQSWTKCVLKENNRAS